MGIVVCKFGGSSTANADCFRRINDIVRDSPERRCVVLSAPGVDAAHNEKVTALLAHCWKHRRERRARRAVIDEIARRYGAIAQALGVDGFADRAAREIEAALGDSEAATLSRGEALSAALFSQYSGIPAVDAKDAVRFDRLGRLDEAGTYARFIGLSRAMDRVVVPGFYGADPDGSIHLFPRNGSDITGALAAAGMGAALYENWTDVPGLMSADPATVPDARLIGRVSYRQMRALARAGARVLHPACLDPVADAGIPTRLCCAADPKAPGTLIDDRESDFVPCIAGKREAALPPRAGGTDATATACVTVFGVPARDILRAAELLRPVCIDMCPESVRLYVERAAYEMSLRALHTRLIAG